MGSHLILVNQPIDCDQFITQTKHRENILSKKIRLNYAANGYGVACQCGLARKLQSFKKQGGDISGFRLH